MDDDTMLDLLAEYSGSWKDRQYYEHVIREIQKKQHLSQLIQEHNHDPRDQLMLEASKRKTVLEIEKKYQQSQINGIYVFPKNFNKTQNNGIDKALEDAQSEVDSYNTSLDVDFYNLKAQNTKKKKTKASDKDLNGKGQIQTLSTNNLKANVNQSQQSNGSNSLSPISRGQKQQNPQAGPLSINKAINIGVGNASINKVEGQNKINSNINNINNNNNNENQIIPKGQQRDEGDERNSKVTRSILNQSQDKNQNSHQNFNGNHSNINSHPLNNNNQSQQLNGAVISPNKQISNKLQGVNQTQPAQQVFNESNQTQIQQQVKNAGSYIQQQQYQKTFLQNQIIKQQQQALLRTSQEDHQQVQKVKNERNNQQGQREKEQDLSDQGVGTRLNTCTNEVEKDPEIISKAQKQTKSQSNSPISKVNGLTNNMNNYYYLSPQTNQQVQQNLTFSSVPNTQNPQMKSNNILLNQNQQQQLQQQDSKSNFNNKIYNNQKNDSQTELKQQRIQQQQFKSANPKGIQGANQQTTSAIYSNLNGKNQNISQNNGKEVVNQHQKQGNIQSNQKEINKHSNAIESILYRQQQQHYATGGLMQPHQILNTQESANGNEDSSLSLVQQSAKSQQQQQHVDSEQQQILKQIHSQNSNQNNIYNSKKLYQLNTNLTNIATTNSHQAQQQNQQQQQQQSLQNVIHNKQRKLVQQNGTIQNQMSGLSIGQHSNQAHNNQQNASPLASHSQQNIMMQNSSQIQYMPSNDNIPSYQNLEQNKNNILNSQQVQQNNQIPNIGYLNENVLSTQPYSEHQASTNPMYLNSEDILSQNSMGIDSQRKSSVRSKRSGAPNGNQDELDNRVNQGQNAPFSQTHQSQFKNKWIDFKKINQQYKGSERVNGGAINQTQYEDNAQNSAAANYRNTFSSVSPNGHQSSSQNNNKKGSSSINNYLSLSNAINVGNSPSIQHNSTQKNKQGLTSSMTQSNHYQNGAINNSNNGQPSLVKAQSHNQNQTQSSNIAVAHLNMQQNLQNQNIQELAAYQIKSGKLGLTDNQSVDKNYHTQFINNAKQYHQQQQFLLQQSQALEEQNQNPAMSTKNVQRKQINKVNSCKSFEIRDKFSKTTSKNNTNNIVINLSNVNNSNSTHNHNLYVQNLNHTTGNHNMSSLNHNNMSNINSSVANQNNPINLQSSLTVSAALNNNSQSKQNLLSSSSNIVSYLPSSQNKNTYSAALYQKSQNNILSKQAKNPGDNSITNLFNNMHSSSSNNMLSNSTMAVASGQNGANSSVNIARNPSQNPSGSVSQSINNLNLNSYLTSHNQNSTTKLSKKIDMYKVFNSTNSNSFTNQKDTQQSSVKQVKNLGLVLQKIIKNKTLKINEKSNQLNQQIQMANNSIQNNLATNNNSNQTAKKQSTPGKKKMSTSGNTQQNNMINNSTVKSPQFSSQLKKNYI